MKDILTYEEAFPILPALCLDLGESSTSIEQGFKDGYHLEYNCVKNYYMWVK